MFPNSAFVYASVGITTLDYLVPAFPANSLCVKTNHLTSITQANKPQECSSGERQVNTLNGRKSLVITMKNPLPLLRIGLKDLLVEILIAIVLSTYILYDCIIPHCVFTTVHGRLCVNISALCRISSSCLDISFLCCSHVISN